MIPADGVSPPAGLRVLVDILGLSCHSVGRVLMGCCLCSVGG